MIDLDSDDLFTLSPLSSPTPHSRPLSPLPPSSPPSPGPEAYEDDRNQGARSALQENCDELLDLLVVDRTGCSSPLSYLSTSDEGEATTEMSINSGFHRTAAPEPQTPTHHSKNPTNSNSQPPSDPGVIYSSPAVARNGKSAAQIKRVKAHRKLSAVLTSRNAIRNSAHRDELLAAVQANKDLYTHSTQTSAKKREHTFATVLGVLARDGYTWGEFVEWISSPHSGHKLERYEGLFRDKARVRRILELWAHKNSHTGKLEVHSWAVEYTARVVDLEGRHTSQRGVLQSRRFPMTGSFILSFDLSAVHEQIRAICPTMTLLMQRFSTTRRQRNRENHSPSSALEQRRIGKARERNNKRVGTALIDLLGERSQNNSLVKHIVGLYLYATGAQRQIISVLSTLGICSSYPSIAGSTHTTPEKLPDDLRDRPCAADKCLEERRERGPSAREDAEWEPGPDDPSDSDSSGQSECKDEDEDEDKGKDKDEDKDKDKDPDEEDRNEGARLTATECLKELEEAAREVATKEDFGLSIDDMTEEFRKACPTEPAAPNRPLFPILAHGAGLLRRVSHSCQEAAKYCAAHYCCGYVYDNINMMFRVAEQILGRKDSQENGTCATIFPLFEAQPEHMQTSDLLHSLDNAPPLLLKEILHSPNEVKIFEDSLKHAVLRIAVNSSEYLSHFQSEVDACLPATDDQIPLHQTDVHPLPAMNIDESSTTGNSEVIDTMFRSLGLDVGTTKFSGLVCPIFGDQLSISRLHTLVYNRAGHETLGNSYAWAVFGPGFFHHQMALTHGIMETHWGDPTAGSRNPACLSFFNTILDRKPIVLSSLPPYCVCRDLIFNVLSAAVLHCLEKIAGQDLEAYARDVTFEKLRADTGKIVEAFGSPSAAFVLREARKAELASRLSSTDATREDDEETSDAFRGASLQSSDMVFENASLFLRDALILREFTDAIKGGYSGRIIRILKVLALMYRGCGRVKYAHELLHLIHNLTHVWPKPLRDIMIKNWLVNPTGRPNSWVPVDLLQEHMNFWIKVIYKAQGSNASWEWLQTVSPCIFVLRRLATQMNTTLGARLGSKHQAADVDRDLSALRESMRENSIFTVQQGRILHGVSQAEVANVISAGLKQLHVPLSEYNKSFKQLQSRLRQSPLVDPSSSRVAGSSSVAPPRLDGQYVGVGIPQLSSEVSADISVASTLDADPAGTQEWFDDEEQYWQELDLDTYEPHSLFAEEEDLSVDIDDL